MAHPTRRRLLLAAPCLGLLALLPAGASPRAAPGKLPWPYLPGARWEYDVKAPVVGRIGRAVRTVSAGGGMTVEVDLELSDARSGTFTYRLAAEDGLLEALTARFEPREEGGEAWRAEVAPGLPLFPVSGCPRPVDRVVRLSITEAGAVRAAQARVLTRSGSARANGYGGLHHVSVEGDSLGRFPSFAEHWISDEAGVVRSRIGSPAAISLTWDLVSYRPAPR